MMSPAVSQPLVSVIMPTYNHARFIGEAIASVRGQTHENFEIIVVDNFSQDDTERIVTGLKDDRIKYSKFRNKGVIAASRNAGLRLAAGEFVAFLDSDDLWFPEKLERQLSYMSEHPNTALVYSKAETFCEGRTLGVTPKTRRARAGMVFDSLLKGNFIGTLTVLALKQNIMDAGLFDEDPALVSVEDYELWLRVARNSEIGFVDAVLARYRVHAGNVSKGSVESRRLCLKVLRKIGEKLSLPESVVSGALGAARMGIAKEHFRQRNIGIALSEARMSVRLSGDPLRSFLNAVEAVLRT